LEAPLPPVTNVTVKEIPHPLVSVLVCTYNRNENVVPTIRSVQACGYPNFELFILDQSKDNLTEKAVLKLTQDDARIKYVRFARPSKPRALNHGRELAKGQFIFLTDDDCEVLPGWIENMLLAFNEDSRIACVFGDVDAGPFDPKEGYIPICRIARSHSIFDLFEFLTMPGWGNFGMGASLALRTDALSEIGGWDPCIGPGAPFKSGDDHDLAARLVAAGYGLAFCANSRAIHFGLRYWSSMGADQARYGFGMGASFAKHLRTRSYYPGPLRVFRNGVLNSARALGLRKGPFGLAYPRSWLLGFWKGLRHPLDRRTRCFIPVERDGDPDSAVHVADVVLRSNQAEPAPSAPSKFG
jgi:glycosyltransferase involved in cell wall biosynthesis